MPRRVNQSEIPEPVNRVLWGRAAGRCQFSGCNRSLWKSPVTQEDVNIAERAHIWSASDDGPRGNEGIDEEQLNSLENLLLFCHDCHRKIDNERDGGRYTAELLQQWKREHEDRVELVTGIEPSKRSYIIVYGAPVGDHSSPLTFQATAPALFPEHYPALDRVISLEMSGPWRDRDPDFWAREQENLRRRFDRDLRPLIESGDIEHLSVFGFAPQPLLMLLGSLLTDIPAAQARQLRREPQSWAWPKDPAQAEFTVQRPDKRDGMSALILSLSATVTNERITRVCGANTNIWKITVSEPGRDCISSPDDLSAFRTVARDIIDEIKAAHGEEAALHVFPAMPVSAAVDFGRIRMPKADTAWRIYDEVKERGGFIEAITLGDVE